MNFSILPMTLQPGRYIDCIPPDVELWHTGTNYTRCD